MNKREMKKKLKAHLALAITSPETEEWAHVILHVDKTETTKARWIDVQIELFKELLREY